MRNGSHSAGVNDRKMTTRRAFAAAEFEQQRQRDSPPLTMASVGTNDVSVAFDGVNCTILDFAGAVFATGVLNLMCEPLWDVAFERNLVQPSPSRHDVAPFKGCERTAAKAQVSCVVCA